MSSNFYLYLDGDSFPAEAWLKVMAPLIAQRLEGRREDSPSIDEWICGSEQTVGVTLDDAAMHTLAPPWARWTITLDFHESIFGEVFVAIALPLRALRWLPVHAPGVRVAAMDGQDMAPVLYETVDAWAERSTRLMLRETVEELVQLVEETG